VAALRDTLVYEEGDKLYLVAPVTPQEFGDDEVAAFAFGSELVQRAPNPHIAWFRGHYVEADIANGNGAMWTAVGAIADVALRTPERDQVPRSKIETALALWKHRFPDVVEEAMHNYERGSLMQSMECLAPNYDCATCGRGYTKLPRGAERAAWCDHLSGVAGVPAVRILRAVVFTGSGLIFGSRGATGADPQAHLETFQQEVAEFHQRVHRDTKPRRKRTMDTREIPVNEYDELRARPERAELDDAIARAEKAERELETAETAQKAAEKERDELKTEVDAAKETARQATLRDERLGTLGGGFLDALGDKTKERLRGQATNLSEEDWTARLEELEELTGKLRDLGKADSPNGRSGDGAFTPAEVARFQGAGGDAGGAGREPTPNQRRSVFADLAKTK
jgi:hypothetical protein